MMGRNLSPILRRELANLDKDADSRKSAMRALKSYVKDLDSKAIPVFLAQVSETKETGSLSGEYTISLYEVLARVHGVKIVPQIDSIMSTIIKTLASSAGSFPLQQACSKVVPAIARYGIDPTTAEDKKRHIIISLCKPLSDSLLGSQESLTSGSALCLKALVESDNWRFASDEMVNKVCQNVAGALEEKSTQTNAHMGLVMALTKHNPLIVEAYGRLLIHSGLRISNAGLAEGNSQKRFSAIQMINFLMKFLDSRSIFSEVELIIEEMRKCQSDQMAFVKGAAYEAEQTAKKIARDKGSKFDNGGGSVTGSNFSRREHSRRRSLLNSGVRSPASASPESQTLDSFGEYDSLVESPVSMTQNSHNRIHDCRSVNRKLWSYENGGVDVSLKDGFLSELTRGIPIYNSPSEQHELADDGEDYTEEFAGFSQRSPRNGLIRGTTPSPQRSRVNVDNIDIFTTPRKLIRSLQDFNDGNSDISEKETWRFRSPSSGRFHSSSSPRQNGFRHYVMHELNGKESLCNGGEQCEDMSESVASADDDPADSDMQQSHGVAPVIKTKIQKPSIEISLWKKGSKMILILFSIIFVVFIALICSAGWDEGDHLVPT
ncbi:hypothetical protein SLE2022_129500 [Rubroshorea leprosula]